MRRHHDHSNSYKESILLGWITYSFRGSVNHRGKEHGGVQADVVLELSPYVLTQRQQEVKWLS